MVTNGERCQQSALISSTQSHCVNTRELGDAVNQSRPFRQKSAKHPHTHSYGYIHTLTENFLTVQAKVLNSNQLKMCYFKTTLHNFLRIGAQLMGSYCCKRTWGCYGRKGVFIWQNISRNHHNDLKSVSVCSLFPPLCCIFSCGFIHLTLTMLFYSVKNACGDGQSAKFLSATISIKSKAVPRL